MTNSKKISPAVASWNKKNGVEVPRKEYIVNVWVRSLRKKGILLARCTSLIGEIEYLVQIGRKEGYFKKEDLSILDFNR